MAGTVKLTTGRRGKTALLLGVGYSARALIPHLKNRGYRVVGTSRDRARCTETAEKLGIEMVVYDGSIHDGLWDVLGAASFILSSIPPGEAGDPFIQSLNIDFTSVAPHVSWAGYLSATSVYGDRAGQWAFEDELLRPSTDRGRRRAEAEMDWIESGAPVHIFRLAGIYGPERGGMTRNPFARIKAGTARAVIKPGHIVNRIHVDDVAAAVVASLDSPDPLRIYNIADDRPAPPQNVINFAADLIGHPRPPSTRHDDPVLSDMARSFYQDCKRAANVFAKQNLGWAPRHANYKAGLMAVYKAQQSNPDLVLLSGHVYVPADDIPAVVAELPDHIEKTRAEPGCERFDVWQDTAEPHIFHVFERFTSPEAFAAHQERMQGSHWAKVSASALRHYEIIGV